MHADSRLLAVPQIPRGVHRNLVSLSTRAAQVRARLSALLDQKLSPEQKLALLEQKAVLPPDAAALSLGEYAQRSGLEEALVKIFRARLIPNLSFDRRVSVFDTGIFSGVTLRAFARALAPGKCSGVDTRILRGRIDKVYINVLTQDGAEGFSCALSTTLPTRFMDLRHYISPPFENQAVIPPVDVAIAVLSLDLFSPQQQRNFIQLLVNIVKSGGLIAIVQSASAALTSPLLDPTFVELYTSLRGSKSVSSAVLRSLMGLKSCEFLGDAQEHMLSGGGSESSPELVGNFFRTPR